MNMRSRSVKASAGLLVLFLAIAAVGSESKTVTASTRLSSPEDRYAMAGGCYLVQASSGAYLERKGNTFAASASGATAEPFHFQATDLGRYLLFGTEKDFLAARESSVIDAVKGVTKSDAGQIVDGVTVGTTDKVADEVARSAAGKATGRGASVVAAPKANELADWEITEAAGAFNLALPETGQRLATNGTALVLVDAPAPGEAFSFTLVDGCATFPEIEVNVDGQPAKGATAIGETRGFIDLHLHAMAFEFIGGRTRCGRPWHPYGVDQALVDCPDHGPNGETAVLEYVLSGGSPVPGHSPDGWPTFAGWPKNGSLTHEQVYYKWLERAWMGGLRLMTNLLVDNHALCLVYPYKKNSCNEMDGVRLQAERLHELQDYIDAQSGGPGEGWFRIVLDPFEAREVINAGKLAVVMGIEVSTPFDCNVMFGLALCDEDDIDKALDEVYALGVRQMELANKFDNALTGVTGDAGPTGIVVNSGNKSETGEYWHFETCPPEYGEKRDKTQLNPRDQGMPRPPQQQDAIFGAVLQSTGKSGVVPVYPEGPHCNTIGLTGLGAYAVRGMIERGMIFDPDHMSARARHEALDILQQEGYSGTVSSHSWADPTVYPRILELGGVVTPHAGGSTGFVNSWRGLKDKKDPQNRYYSGFGYGSDVNGFSTQGAARNPIANRVTYPFTGFGGVTVHKQVSGTKTYDINTDGVAHYGLYPDWIEDLQKVAGPVDGPAILADMSRGTEAFLQMWERAWGVDPDACRSDVADLPDLDAVTVGMDPEQVLRAVGQPSSRSGSAFTYCLTSARTGTVAFDTTGHVTGVTIA